MTSNFLDKLRISATSKRKLAELGTTHPAALLGMMDAAPEAFDRFLGKTSAQDVRRALSDLLSENERTLLTTGPPHVQARGAIVDRAAPPVAPPRYDMTERDRLFSELQALRQQENPLPATQQRIADLERCLTAMLEAD